MRALPQTFLALAILTADPTGIQAAALNAQQGSERVMAATSAQVKPLLEQPAKLAIQDARLFEALMELQRRSGINLVFSPSRISDEGRVSCACEEMTVAETLDRLFAGTFMRYTEIGSHIVIKPGESERQVPTIAPGSNVFRLAQIDLPPNEAAPVQRLFDRQEAVVAGVVVNAATGQPLEGAQVVVQATNRGVTTNAQGRFRIDVVDGVEVTLEVVMLGYKTITQRVRVGNMDVRIALEETPMELEQIVVTGSVIESRVREMAVPVAVITSQDIERKQINRIDELFRGMVPSVIAWDGGPGDEYSSINVRGRAAYGSSKFKVYIDGIEFTEFAYIKMIDPNSIERIEAIRGPQASTLYGADAINGVLQIFTKKGTKDGLRSPRITAQATAGVIESDFAGDDAPAVDEQRYSFQLDGGRENFSYNTGVSHTREGEWVPQNNERLTSVHGGLSVAEGSFTAASTLRYSERQMRRVASPVLRERFPSIYGGPLSEPERIVYSQQTLGLNLSYLVTPRWKHNLIVGYDRTLLNNWRDPRFETPSDTFGFSQNINWTKTSIRYNTSLELNLGNDVTSTLTAGFDDWTYWIDRGTTQQAPQLKEGSFNASATLQAETWDNRGYFSQFDLGFQDVFFVTAGLRADDSPNLGDEHGLAWAPRIGATYIHELDDVQIKFRGSYGKAIRPPRPRQKQGTEPSGTYSITYPNPNLGPEEQTGWEGGVDFYLGNRASLTATYYDQDVKGMIQFVTLEPRDYQFEYQYQNVGRVKNRGWEFEGSLDMAPFHLRAAYSITESTIEELWSGYSGYLEPGDDNTGVPENMLGATLTYYLFKGSASLELSRIGSWIESDQISLVGDYFELSGDPFRGFGQYFIGYEPVTKLHFQVEQAITDDWNASLRVENLTNRQIGEPINSGFTAGRTIRLGLRFTS